MTHINVNHVEFSVYPGDGTSPLFTVCVISARMSPELCSAERKHRYFGEGPGELNVPFIGRGNKTCGDTPANRIQRIFVMNFAGMAGRIDFS
jgi:hypothetical protein